MNDPIVKKVLQIHLLLNQAMYIFEDLPDGNKFFEKNQELYEKIVKLSENLTDKVNKSQSNNYAYTLGKLQKAIQNIKI